MRLAVNPWTKRATGHGGGRAGRSREAARNSGPEGIQRDSMPAGRGERPKGGGVAVIAWFTGVQRRCTLYGPLSSCIGRSRVRLQHK